MSAPAKPAPALPAALWPISMMSSSPLDGQEARLVPNIQPAGHKPVPTCGVLIRNSIKPYLTWSLFEEVILPDVNECVPCASLRASIAKALVAGSKGTLTMLRLAGL